MKEQDAMFDLCLCDDIVIYFAGSSMKFILSFLLLAPVLILTQESLTYTDFHIGDTVRPLKPQSIYPMRVYVFTDRSSCTVWMINIERFFEQMRDYPVEFVVFVDGYSQSDAETFRKEE